MDAGDSTIEALDRSGGNGKLIALGVVVAAALAAAAWFLLGLGGSRGAKDTPGAVLIIGPETDDLAGWINDRGFSAEQLTYNSAINSGHEFAPDAEDLEAIVALADEKGFGYVAFHPPDLYDYGAITGGETAKAPAGATMAVLNVGDIEESPRMTFGVPSPAVEHRPPAAKRVGLLLALFEQPALARIRTDDVDVGDIALLNALTDADTLRRFDNLKEAQEGFEARAAAWNELATVPKGSLPVAMIGGAYEGVDAYPLAGGGILALVATPRWVTDGGLRSRLEEDEGRTARYLPPDAVAQMKTGAPPPEDAGPCGPLDADEIRALRVNESGTAMAVQRFVPDSNIEGEPSTTGSWVVQFVKQADLPRCPFAVTGYALGSRQMYDLGPVDTSGAMLMPSNRLRFGLKGRERSWNYPVLTPAGSAAVWVDPTLAAFSAGPHYGESDISGLAFMTSLTENRLEAFFPLSTLLPKHEVDDMQIVHLRAVAPGRFRLVVDDRKTLKKLLVEVEFTKPIRSFLVPVDHTGDMLRQLYKLTYTSRAGLKTRILLDGLPDFETAAFDAAAQRLAFVDDGKAYVLDVDKADAAPQLLSGDQQVTHVRIAPDASFAIFHRVIESEGQPVTTATVVWIE